MLKVTSKSFVGQKQELFVSGCPFQETLSSPPSTTSAVSLQGRGWGGSAGSQKDPIFVKARQVYCMLDSALVYQLEGTSVLQRWKLANVSPPTGATSLGYKAEGELWAKWGFAGGKRRRDGMRGAELPVSASGASPFRAVNSNLKSTLGRENPLN